MMYNEVITSSQNQYVSLTRSLENRKNREKQRLFRIDGVKLMCEAVKKGVNIRFALFAERLCDFVLERAEKLYGVCEKDLDFKLITVSDRIFEQLSEEKSPEGVICVAEYLEDMHREVSAEEAVPSDTATKILLLESLRDPQNVGAVIRVAAAFGVDRIIMSNDCADIYSSKTLRAAMGTAFAIPIDRTCDLPLTVRKLTESGRRVFAAALNRDSKKLGEFKILSGDCVVIGNEGHGLSSDTVDACGESVFIPMSDGVESLNAATAAAVLVWEFFGSGRI